MLSVAVFKGRGEQGKSAGFGPFSLLATLYQIRSRELGAFANAATSLEVASMVGHFCFFEFPGGLSAKGTPLW